MKSIPLKLDSHPIPKLLEVRGEVFINHDDFKLFYLVDKWFTPLSKYFNC